MATQIAGNIISSSVQTHSVIKGWGTFKNFFDRLSNQLGHKSMDDWYNITQDTIIKKGGRQLLNYYYGGSPSKALLSIYPDHDWMLWKFKQVPNGYWDNLDIKEICRIMDWLGEHLHVKTMEDWYKCHYCRSRNGLTLDHPRVLISMCLTENLDEKERNKLKHEIASSSQLWLSKEKGGSSETELHQLFAIPHKSAQYTKIKAPPNNWMAHITFLILISDITTAMRCY